MRPMTLSSLVVTATLLGACGGSSSGMGGGTCNPTMATAVTIRSTGVTPMAVCVLPTGTVTFTNSDTASHDIEDTGTTCPQLNLGVIAAGGTARATMPTVVVCQYHDQLNPTNTAFQGVVAVTNTPPPPGPGY